MYWSAFITSTKQTIFKALLQARIAIHFIQTNRFSSFFVTKDKQEPPAFKFVPKSSKASFPRFCFIFHILRAWNRVNSARCRVWRRTAYRRSALLLTTVRKRILSQVSSRTSCFKRWLSVCHHLTRVERIKPPSWFQQRTFKQCFSLTGLLPPFIWAACSLETKL